MPSPTTDHLSPASVAKLRSKRDRLRTDLVKLERFIAAAEEYFGHAPAAKKAPSARTKAPTVPKRGRSTVGVRKPDQSPVQTALLAVMRSNGKRAWSAADLTAALAKRGLVPAEPREKATAKVRKALNGLRTKGVLASERQGKGDFATTAWKVAGQTS